MIEGGWPLVAAAYAVAALALLALATSVLLRARHWAREARRLENP